MPEQVTLSYALADQLPAVTADPEQLQQVLINLVENAAESIESGYGQIKIATAFRESSTDQWAGSEFVADMAPGAGAYACLIVSDDGRGIPAEQVPHIWEPFFTTKFTGRGLGLSVVQGIVRSFQGALQVTSTSGAGSTIVVWWPTAVKSSLLSAGYGGNDG